jgi:stage II sporulation protein D
VNRLDFVIGVASLPLAPRRPLQNDTIDPANAAQAQALRVLLGKGDAQSLDSGTFVFDGRRYRGTFAALSSGEIVNTVPLEQYLYSVVSREMPYSWPAAALQAQAIVARTYVLQRSNPQREYDLVPSEADQVYTGVDAEHPQSSAAVDATAGEVLRFGDAFAQVLYSSCCGGHTESNDAAWGGKPLAYLGGVQCPYCTASPWYTWSRDFQQPQLQQALAAQLGPVSGITGITLDERDGSGRARFWTISSGVAVVRVKAEDVRRALGTRVLPSLLVHSLSFTQADQRVTIEGGGLGHGVGLCQWGARGMALTGAGARAILAYYYPGTGTGND